MQARTASGSTRFSATQRALENAIPQGADVTVTLYATAPQTHLVAGPISVARAKAAMDRLTPIDAAQNPLAVATLLGGLVSGHHFAQTFFASASSLSPPVPQSLHAFAVGGPLPNFALGSFAVSRAGFGAGALKARLEVANFSPRPQDLQVEISAGGMRLATAPIRLEAREIGGVEFPTLAPSSAYRADLKPSDGFPLDNVAFATPRTGGEIQVLFVSPTPADGAALAGLPGLHIRTMPPEKFSPQEAKADLVIFEYGVPKELPSANALLVMPPGGDPVFDLKLMQGQVSQVAGWRSPDPLTDGVNFRLLALRQPESFGVHPWMESVVNSNLGALIMEGTRQGHRYVALGFNPFPYLGTKNLPMSILTLNILGYLSGFGSEDAGYRTGYPWTVPAGVSEIITPEGRKVSVQAGARFSEDTTQGIYQLMGPGSQRRLRAINLADLAVSDLENPRPIGLNLHPQVREQAPDFSERITFTAHLIAAILALAACEAIFTYRRRRPARVAQA